jgi:hypothetical protein
MSTLCLGTKHYIMEDYRWRGAASRLSPYTCNPNFGGHSAMLPSVASVPVSNQSLHLEMNEAYFTGLILGWAFS